MGIELLIFDFDGVLVDSEYITGQVTCKHLEKYGVKTDLETTLRKYVGMHDSVRREHLSQDIGESRVDKFIEETKAKSLQVYKDRLKPIKNTKLMLDQLDIPYCIASNSRMSSLKQKLEITGLDAYFSTSQLFVGSMVKKPKPAPDIYLLAADEHNTPTENCLVIEDSVHGINSAIGANMQVYGFYGASHCYENYESSLLKAGASLVFNDLLKFPRLIHQINQQP